MQEHSMSPEMFASSLNDGERTMLARLREHLHSEGLVDNNTNGEVLFLRRAREAVALHHRGLVSERNLRLAFAWALRHPNEDATIESIIDALGLRHMHERGDAAGEWKKLSAHHNRWYMLYAAHPEQAVREATNAIIRQGRGLCNPHDAMATAKTHLALSASLANAGGCMGKKAC